MNAPLNRTVREVAMDVSFDAEYRGIKLSEEAEHELSIASMMFSSELSEGWGGSRIATHVKRLSDVLKIDRWVSPILDKCLAEIDGAVENYYQSLLLEASGRD